MNHQALKKVNSSSCHQPPASDFCRLPSQCLIEELKHLHHQLFLCSGHWNDDVQRITGLLELMRE
ncbi:hypothetical protein ACSF7A_06870 [Escherichia coli]|uniref:hypothetical protein n=1 Tax=Escherichia coli TaxID=562 RepID=UPI003EEE4BCD